MKEDSIEQKQNKGTELIVREANELVESSYRFNVWEDRIFLLTLSQIKPQDEDFKEYKIYIRDLAKKYNIGTHDVYALVKNAVETLRRKKITIPYRFGEDMGHFSTGLLAAYGEVNKEDLSYIVVELHPKLKPYLLQLKERFTQYNIGFLMRMQSSHSKRIYKLLKQFEKIGKRSFSIEKLREILGIEPQEYKQYFDFKRRFILKAQEDLKQYTDISFRFEEEKKGRSVHKICFYIFPNQPSEEPLSFFDEKNEGEDLLVSSRDITIDTPLFLLLQSWGISRETYLIGLEEYGIEKLQNCATLTQNSKKAKDKAAYFLGLLKKEILAPPPAVEKESKKDSISHKEAWEKALAALKKEQYQKEQELIQQLLLDSQIVEAAKTAALTKSFHSFDDRLSFEENYQQKRAFKALIDTAVMELNPQLFEPIWAASELQKLAIKKRFTV